MPTKPKKTQPKNVEQVRDCFYTPHYGTDLIIPYLHGTIWECASGDMTMSKRMMFHGFKVLSTELKNKEIYINDRVVEARSKGFDFLKDHHYLHFDMIVTNVPFSIKELFYKKCMEYGKPFALLIPADFSGWVLKAMRDDGAQWIIPERRIDYITPNIAQNVYEGETRANICKGEKISRKALKKFAPEFEDIPAHLVSMYSSTKYERVEDIPAELIYKYSASQFHSGWLTHGLGLPKDVNVVDLSNEQKKRGYIYITSYGGEE